MSIRPYRPEDEAACALIFETAWNFAFPHARRFIGVSVFRSETEEEEIFVAESDGRIVGFSALYAPEAFLHHLYVAPARHRTGVGSALLTHAMATALAPITLKCQINNAPAMRLYARHGFEGIGNGVDSTGAWALLRAPARDAD